VASSSEEGRTAVAVRPATLNTLTERLGVTIGRREEIRVWSLSGVERLFLTDAGTAILKYAVEVFANEPRILRHAADHGTPVPALWADLTQDDGSTVMVMEDLGPQIRETDLGDAARAAVAVHECPPFPSAPVLNADGLADLPRRALRWLDALQEDGRWSEAQELRRDLRRLQQVARRRASGAQIPPFGMCHSEFHPTSIHIGEGGRLTVMDWARAYTGPGLLDLVSWQGTPKSLDLDAVSELITAYVAAGGPQEAMADRGGLPAHVWAGGWDKLWIIEWFLESTFRWGDPADDQATAQAVGVHLAEAVECLT
jgi:Phosphotransferase enzyme family